MDTYARPELEMIPFDPGARDLGMIVGYDGSENSQAAIRYAADVAVRRAIPLTVVSTYRAPVPIYANPAALRAQKEDGAHQRRAESLLEKAAELLAEHPGDVGYVAAEGDSVGALADLSSHGQQIVVGARGRGGFRGLLRGSVAASLPAHAACPTVVVPPGELPEASLPVAVGTDISSHSRVAVLQAAQIAGDREAPLLIVMALPHFDRGDSLYPMTRVDAEQKTQGRRQELQKELEDEVRWLNRRMPGVEVSAEVRIGEPAGVLQDAARGAQLTVVGTRGRGAVASRLLGSTSREVLHEAEGPIMVVPYLEDDRVKVSG